MVILWSFWPYRRVCCWPYKHKYRCFLLVCRHATKQETLLQLLGVVGPAFDVFVKFLECCCHFHNLPSLFTSHRIPSSFPVCLLGTQHGPIFQPYKSIGRSWSMLVQSSVAQKSMKGLCRRELDAFICSFFFDFRYASIWQHQCVHSQAVLTIAKLDIAARQNYSHADVY